MPAEKHGKGTAFAGIPLISPAKDGLGPEGRKKLKNAGVPMKPILGEEQFVEPGCPSASTPGIITKILELPSARQENAPVLEGTTTVSGFPTLSPEAAALKAFCASRRGSVEFTSCGRFRCNPRVDWKPRLNFQEPAIARSMVRFACCAWPYTKSFANGSVNGRMGSGNPAVR